MADGQAVRMASVAAERVERAREVGVQLALFGPPAAPAVEPEAAGRIGRPKGARSKVKTQLRELMAAQGWRDPASQLAYLAGLNSRDDPDLVAVGRAEALLVAAGDQAECEAALADAKALLAEAANRDERRIAFRAIADARGALVARAERVVDLALAVRKEMRLAADALLPYVFAKVTPDVVDQRQQMFIQMAAPGAGAAPGAVTARLGPPPMPSGNVEQDQHVSDAPPEKSDGGLSDGNGE
jgi:hypothetical protein